MPDKAKEVYGVSIRCDLSIAEYRLVELTAWRK
jgi:hypothetical protein